MGGGADVSLCPLPAPAEVAGLAGDCGAGASSDDGAQASSQTPATVGLPGVAGPAGAGRERSGPSPEQGELPATTKKKAKGKEKKGKGAPRDAPSSAEGPPTTEPDPTPDATPPVPVDVAINGVDLAGEGEAAGAPLPSPVPQPPELGGSKDSGECLSSQGLAPGVAGEPATPLVTPQPNGSDGEVTEMEVQLFESRKRRREQDGLSPPKKTGCALAEPVLDSDDERRLMGLDIEGMDAAGVGKLPPEVRPRRSSLGNIHPKLAEPPWLPPDYGGLLSLLKLTKGQKNVAGRITQWCADPRVFVKAARAAAKLMQQDLSTRQMAYRLEKLAQRVRVEWGLGGSLD